MTGSVPSWLTPEFADRVDDIVLEMGNSLYQKSVDGYVRGEEVPLEQVQKAWRNTVGLIGSQSPVVAGLYQTVREINMKRRGKHHMRIICGDPRIDWDTVKEKRRFWPSAIARCSSWARCIFCVMSRTADPGLPLSQRCGGPEQKPI
jgi:hypothetical protein